MSTLSLAESDVPAVQVTAVAPCAQTIVGDDENLAVPDVLVSVKVNVFAAASAGVPSVAVSVVTVVSACVAAVDATAFAAPVKV